MRNKRHRVVYLSSFTFVVVLIWLFKIQQGRIHIRVPTRVPCRRQFPSFHFLFLLYLVQLRFSFFPRFFFHLFPIPSSFYTFWRSIYFFPSNHLVFFIYHFTVSFFPTFCSSTLNYFLLFSTTIVFIFYTLISFSSFVVFFYPLYFATCALLFSIFSSFIFLYFSWNFFLPLIPFILISYMFCSFKQLFLL